MIYVLTFLLYAILEFYILVSGVGYYCIKMLKDFLICAGLRKLRISSYTATASTPRLSSEHTKTWKYTIFAIWII